MDAESMTAHEALDHVTAACRVEVRRLVDALRANLVMQHIPEDVAMTVIAQALIEEGSALITTKILTDTPAQGNG